MATHPCRPILAAALLLTCTTCSPDPDASASKAQRALDAKRYSEAIAISEAGLAAVRGDPKERRTIWRLERLRVEALAGSGDADAVLASLERLSGTFPAHVSAPLLRELAQDVFHAGDVAAAERLLAWGAERIPGDEPLFSDLATFWKHGGAVSPAECERLRSLGYLSAEARGPTSR